MKRKVHIDETARKILDQLERSYRMPDEGEGRKHPRKSWCVVLSVEFEIENGALTLQRTEEVTTHDISQGGFSFIFNENLIEKTRVKARFDMLPNKPTIYGEVRSSRHLYGTQHRIGVCFIEVGTADKQKDDGK